jgi:hypothetical protein
MASVGTDDGLAEAVPSPGTQRLGSGDALRAPLPNPHLLALDPPATRYWPPTLPISDLLLPISCEAPLRVLCASAVTINRGTIRGFFTAETQSSLRFFSPWNPDIQSSVGPRSDGAILRALSASAVNGFYR